MADFKSYMSGAGKSGPQGGKQPSREEIERLKSQITERDVKNVENIAKKYDGMSEAQLMREIQTMAQKNRSEGKLSEREIEEFERNITPMLDASQRQRLNQILSMMRK